MPTYHHIQSSAKRRRQRAPGERNTRNVKWAPEPRPYQAYRNDINSHASFLFNQLFPPSPTMMPFSLLPLWEREINAPRSDNCAAQSERHTPPT